MTDAPMSLDAGVVPYVNALFQQPWWLEAAAPGAWGAVVVEAGGAVVARMPYVVERRFGLTLLTMPPATQTLGPWVAPTAGKAEAVLAREHKLMARLIDQLPRCDAFVQNFHASITNWLPFYWKGYTQTTRYTYTIDLASPLGEIWDGMRDKTRNAIRKAEREGVRVTESDDLDAFIALQAMTFERVGLERAVPPATIRRLYAAARARGAGRILLATGADGRHHSGILSVYDDRTWYYLMQGGDPALRSSGANALCVWVAIHTAKAASRVFDFEGSMMTPVEHFVRSFGARQTPYLRVSRVAGAAALLYHGREAWRALRAKGPR